MTFTRAELKKLTLPLLLAIALLGAGIALVSYAQQSLKGAQRRLAAAQSEHQQNAARLARIAEEEREVRQKLDVYRRLQSLQILGEERRLEWADAIKRIRADRELLDLRYRVERQKLLRSAAAKPGTVDLYSSTMTVDLSLLHEGDLLRFLADLRQSGNAYYSVKKCSLSRTGAAPTGATIVPRLHAQCEIDLVTIQDGGAKR